MPPSIKFALAGSVISAIGVILWRLFDEDDAAERVRHYELLGAGSTMVLGGALVLLGLALAALGP
ncbi:hypothetical protein ASD11_14240 [Aeromicrobium sp. Root495]|uniref:hypothetical protein n=1 Tax=Aeromicrobium sp. Root495 TaxID=1736550 RepID=UPI0006F61431|nr:hypothetical protein [Aeromicrobium sp. Root495]KQY55671.1 hypothetical protein ASD11_14240 [Aeromicrobium sp. Root495]